jgi:hypothetical protein
VLKEAIVACFKIIFQNLIIELSVAGEITETSVRKDSWSLGRETKYEARTPSVHSNITSDEIVIHLTFFKRIHIVKFK